MAKKEILVTDNALYVVNTPLLHNQESFAMGSEVELTESEAAPLLAVRAVELKPVAVESEPNTSEVENG